MRTLRLAFLVPALLAAVPVAAQPAAPKAAPIRYVTLDKMIRKFAEQARAQHARTAAPKAATVVAQR